MTERFSIEIHEKRMRELLKPKPPAGDLLTKFKEVANKRKGEVKPPVIK